MKNSKRGFDYIWDSVIQNVIEYCEKDMDPEFVENAGVVAQNLIKYKNGLRELYHKKREWLKIEYLPTKKNATLDFHKLSAIICRCIIGLKPISYNEKTAKILFDKVQKKKFSLDKKENTRKKLQWQIKNIYVNYRIAFLVSGGIVYDDLLCWVQNKLDNNLKLQDIDDKVLERRNIYEKLKSKLIDNSTLYDYIPSLNHDDFESSMIVSLMKNDVLKRDFDYLSFSSGMFQWQEHTKLKLLGDIFFEMEFKNYNFQNISELFYVDENEPKEC